MKRESYKKGPRFGPEAWRHRDEKQTSKPVEEVVVKQPVVEVVEEVVVEQPVVEVVEEVVVEQPAVEVLPSKPAFVQPTTTQEVKVADKKKK